MRVVRALILTLVFLSAFAHEQSPQSPPSELHEIDLHELDEGDQTPGSYYIEQTLLDLEDLLDSNEAFERLSDAEKAEFLEALAKFEESLSQVLFALTEKTSS